MRLAETKLGRESPSQETEYTPQQIFTLINAQAESVEKRCNKGYHDVDRLVAPVIAPAIEQVRDFFGIGTLSTFRSACGFVRVSSQIGGKPRLRPIFHPVVDVYCPKDHRRPRDLGKGIGKYFWVDIGYAFMKFVVNTDGQGDYDLFPIKYGTKDYGHGQEPVAEMLNKGILHGGLFKAGDDNAFTAKEVVFPFTGNGILTAQNKYCVVVKDACGVPAELATYVAKAGLLLDVNPDYRFRLIDPFRIRNTRALEEGEFNPQQWSELFSIGARIAEADAFLPQTWDDLQPQLGR